VGTRADPLITVVYPISDVRGRAVDRVRTWTSAQTLSRERYRVLVVSDGADVSQEREVEPLLGAQDALARAAGGRDAALWNHGAARAGTPWILFTEGHCLAADPDCLGAVARWIATGPRDDVGNLRVAHPDDYVVARLSRRWFDEVQAGWRGPGEWPRVHRAGFAIRADAFFAVGGFEPGYGQFAAPLLSARLHARGFTVGQVPGAAVVHVDDRRMRHHHADTADHVRGELDARARLDAAFAERYFGHAPAWTNRLRHQPGVARLMARAALAAAVARPDRGRELAGLLAPLVARAVVGLAPRIAAHRLAVALEEAAVERLPLPDRWRWARVLRAHARVVHLGRLEWLRRHAGATPPRAGVGRWPIEALGPDTAVGLHALEERDGRRFRWTEPVALLRLATPDGEHELRIETGGLRGGVADAVLAVVVGGRALPRALVSGDGDGALVVRLPPRWAAAAREGIVLVCSPLVPARAGAADPRRLGLPVLSVALLPAPARAAVPAVPV
jgi:hypothetical protein